MVLLKARVDLQNGDLTAGRTGIAKALKLDPNFMDAILVSSALEAVDDPDQGLAILDAAIARFPADKTKERRELRERRVALLSQAKRFGEAEQGLAELSKEYPDEVSYPFQLARLYVRQGRNAEAEQLLMRVTELEPKDVKRRLDYAQFLMGLGETDKAEAALRKFTTELPDSDALGLALGQLYEANKRLPEAKAAYQSLADRSPKSSEGVAARIRLAVMASVPGENDPGMKIIDEILVDIPDEPTALLLRAGSRYQKKQYDDAIADLRGVLRKQPANETAMLLLARIHVLKKEPLVAKDVYRRLLAVNPGSDDGLSGLVALYTSEVEFAEAERLVRDRLQVQPDDLAASSLLIDLLLTQGQKDKAEDEARRMASLPNQAGLGDYAFGRVLALKQDYGAAVDAYRKSLAARAEDRMAMQGLVESLKSAGKTQEAIEALKDLQASGSANSQIFSGLLLADLYGQQNDRASAEKALEAVIRSRPVTVEAYLALARLNDKDPAAQIRIYERGLKAVPAQPQLSLLLAGALDATGQYDQSIAVLETLVKASPAFQPGVNNLVSALLDHRTDKASIERAVALTKSLEGLRRSGRARYGGLGPLPSGGLRPGRQHPGKGGGEGRPGPGLSLSPRHGLSRPGQQGGAKQQLDKAIGADANYVGIDVARATAEKLKTRGFRPGSGRAGASSRRPYLYSQRTF